MQWSEFQNQETSSKSTHGVVREDLNDSHGSPGLAATDVVISYFLVCVVVTVAGISVVAVAASVVVVVFVAVAYL